MAGSGASSTPFDWGSPWANVGLYSRATPRVVAVNLSYADAQGRIVETIMAELGKAYIGQSILFTQHPVDPRVRFRQEEAEAAFSPVMNVQSQQTNLPDDVDANAPRLIFQSNNKQLLISKNAIQAICSFEGADKTIDDQLDIIIANFDKVSDRIPRFQEPSGEVGFVVTVNVPSIASRAQMSEAVFDQYLNFPKFGDVASANFKIGFQTSDGFFINFECDVYELRDFQMSPAMAGQLIDMSKLPLREMGYSFKVDINNKPKLGDYSSYKEEYRQVAAAMKEFMADKFLDLVRI